MNNWINYPNKIYSMGLLEHFYNTVTLFRDFDLLIFHNPSNPKLIN